MSSRLDKKSAFWIAQRTVRGTVEEGCLLWGQNLDKGITVTTSIGTANCVYLNSMIKWRYFFFFFFFHTLVLLFIAALLCLCDLLRLRSIYWTAKSTWVKTPSTAKQCYFFKCKPCKRLGSQHKFLKTCINPDDGTAKHQGGFEKAAEQQILNLALRRKPVAWYITPLSIMELLSDLVWATRTSEPLMNMEKSKLGQQWH